MLEYTTAAMARARDAAAARRREARVRVRPGAGLRDTKVGAFTQKLYDEAKKKGWTVISMKDDWNKCLCVRVNPTCADARLSFRDSRRFQSLKATMHMNYRMIADRRIKGGRPRRSPRRDS
jgi:hypothetical protein